MTYRATGQLVLELRVDLLVQFDGDVCFALEHLENFIGDLRLQNLGATIYVTGATFWVASMDWRSDGPFYGGIVS